MLILKHLHETLSLLDATLTKNEEGGAVQVFVNQIWDKGSLVLPAPATSGRSPLRRATTEGSKLVAKGFSTDRVNEREAYLFAFAFVGRWIASTGNGWTEQKRAATRATLIRFPQESCLGCSISFLQQASLPRAEEPPVPAGPVSTRCRTCHL